MPSLPPLFFVHDRFERGVRDGALDRRLMKPTEDCYAFQLAFRLALEGYPPRRAYAIAVRFARKGRDWRFFRAILQGENDYDRGYAMGYARVGVC